MALRLASKEIIIGREYGPAIDMFVGQSRVFTGAQPRGAIVIHKTAGFNTAQDCARFFATVASEVSSHFIIGLDGTVVQCVSLDDGAAANCCLVGAYNPYWNQYGGVNLNTVTISIEHIDSATDNSTAVTNTQYDASKALCLWLRDNYDMQSPDVMTHASIDPVNRARCPGNFPMQALIDSMQKVSIPPVPINNPISPNMIKAFHAQWHSAVAQLPVGDTGIYSDWAQAKANGINYNAPTSLEYKSNDWAGNVIVAQDGGNWHAEFTAAKGTTFYQV